MHSSFEGETRVETGGAWIAVNVTFGFLLLPVLSS
jgi:hypothetical protein